MAGSCEHGNERSVSFDCWGMSRFPDQLLVCQDGLGSFELLS
jgi:hypothetical protein